MATKPTLSPPDLLNSTVCPLHRGHARGCFLSKLLSKLLQLSAAGHSGDRGKIGVPWTVSLVHGLIYARVDFKY